MKSFLQNQTIPNHKQRLSCLSKCLTWSLSITLKTCKTTLSYQYLPKSILISKGVIDTFNELNEIDSKEPALPKTIISNQEQQKANDKVLLQHLTLPIETKPTFYQYAKRLSIMDSVTEDNFTLVIPIELDNNSSSPKEHLKLLREINNAFLTREIYCNLNGTIHNQKFLSKDIQFIIEPKRLVKSIQFRIEKYKQNWLKNNSNSNGTNKPSFKKAFFTMLIDNQSIGIEFIKKIDDLEVLQTNFNSIVNGNVTLSRVFLFLPIPQDFLLPKAVLYKKPQQIESSKITKETAGNYTEAQENAHQIQKKSSSRLSLEKFFSPKNIMINYGYPSIASEISNAKRNKFNTFGFNDFPEIVINNNKIKPSKDLSLSNEGNDQKDYQYYTVTKMGYSVNSNCSIKKGNTKPITKRKRLNESLNAKIDTIIKEYSPTCNYLLFSKQCSLSIASSSKEDYYNMNLVSFFNVFKFLSLFGLEVNYVLIDDNSSIEDIQKITYFPTLSSMTITITEEAIIEPILKEIANKKIRQSLSDKTPSVQSMDKIEDLDNENKTNCSEAYTEYIIIDGLKVIVGQDSLKIEFIEAKPPFIRSLLSHQIAKCFSCLKSFELINIEKVVNNSWFSVSWNPDSVNKDQRLQKTIFLAYYQFKLSSEECNNSNNDNKLYQTIPPIGILPIKYDERQWLSPICKDNDYDVKDYDHLINKAMTNVEEYVYLNTNQTSIDYDFYLKSLMAKQHSFTSQNNQLLNSLADC